MTNQIPNRDCDNIMRPTKDTQDELELQRIRERLEMERLKQQQLALASIQT